MCAVDISKDYMLNGFIRGDKPFSKTKLSEIETILNGYKILLLGLDKALEKFDVLVREMLVSSGLFLISKFSKDYFSNASLIRIDYAN